MYKDSTYKEKLATLKKWAPEIVDLIKRDLKNEHLKKDYVFCKKYFPGKVPQKISSAELAQGYLNALENEEASEQIAEFLTHRWMLQKGDIYGYFEKELLKLNPDFDSIETIEDNVATPLIKGSIDQFGALSTYIFSVLNSVAFSKARFDELLSFAEAESVKKKESHKKEEALKSFEEMKRDFEAKLLRLEDKYEKRLEGLQKKYIRDTEMLKKQIANLQRKLNG